MSGSDQAQWSAPHLDLQVMGRSIAPGSSRSGLVFVLGCIVRRLESSR